MKKGILLVAFGTSDQEAQKAFTNMEKLSEQRFPGIPVSWAFTSLIIRKKLAEQGQILDSPEEALTKLKQDGITHLAVQSLHIVPGDEYHKVIKAIFRHQDDFQKITLGKPLLFSGDDLDKVAKAILANQPKGRQSSDAIVLMGHGNEHGICDLSYIALDEKLRNADKNIFLGTVEGRPNLDEVKVELKKSGVKNAFLIPFMAVAGDHAKNDLAGNEDDSWKSELSKMDIKCVPVLIGAGEIDGIANIWVDHLGTAIIELDNKPKH